MAKPCFKLDHCNANLCKIYRLNQSPNWPDSSLTGWGWFTGLVFTLNFAHCGLYLALISEIPMKITCYSQNAWRYHEQLWLSPVDVLLTGYYNYYNTKPAHQTSDT